MNPFGANINAITDGLSVGAVQGSVSTVFSTFAPVLVGAILLTLTVYFIRKILNGANKGKARLR